MGVPGRIALGVALAFAGGCLDSGVTTCEDGLLCPVGTVCSAQGCVLPEQVEACATLADGDECGYTGVNNGRCVDGVCVAFACGNGVEERDQGEVCDDGNTDSGDGCRSDCRKRELCGDEVEDAGEDCDDGNTNAADGCDACVETTWTATALVGGDLSAIEVGLAYPSGIAADGLGNVYVVDRENHRVRRIDGATGAATVVAGTGGIGYGGDGGAATSARLDSPAGLAIDGLGNLYVADAGNSAIRRIDGRTGVITTVAGTGVAGTSVDGGVATSTELFYARGVAVDGLGNLYIADTDSNRVRRVDAITGVISTVAGTGAYGGAGDGGLATAAELRAPSGLAIAPSGDLYIADTNGHRVRRVSGATGVITTFAGTGSVAGLGDGVLATSASVARPEDVALDAAGNLYIADTGHARIRRVDAVTRVITTVAGNGVEAFGGDLGPATAASLWLPTGVDVDAAGTLFVSDTHNDRVRRVISGEISTFAGSGSHGPSGYDGAATAARLSGPESVAVDALGNVYLADTGNERVRMLAAGTDVFVPVAGNGQRGTGGDGGPATAAQLARPAGPAVNALGDVYIVDEFNSRIRRIASATGVIDTVVGDYDGFNGDGGLAAATLISYPSDAVFDLAGNLYFSDTGNHRVRRVDADTTFVTTVAGNGTPTCTASSGLATTVPILSPAGLTIDAVGNLFVADSGCNVVWRIDASTQLLTRAAGTGTEGFDGDGGQATLALINNPSDVALDSQGNLAIADRNNHRVRRVAPGGVISTIVGLDVWGTQGDGGPASAAGVQLPSSVAFDGADNLYIVDFENDRLRRVDAASGAITTVAGEIDPDGMGPLASAHLADPRALVLTPGFTWIAGGATGTVQRVGAAAVEAVAGRYPHTVATGNLARFRDADFGAVGGVAFDATAGVLYLTETTADRVHVVTLVDPDDETTWTIAPLAVATSFRAPTGLYLDEPARTLYVADTGNHAIRAIDLETETVTTIAGTPQTLGFHGDGGAATDALLYQPEAITRCGNGDLFVADTGNHRVRRIADGTITTVLGDGVASSSGQGTPARDFPVREPRGLACDASGNLYVTSSTTVRQVAADELGVVDGTLRVTSIFGAPPRDTFPASVSYCLTGLAIVDDATLQVTDSCTGMLIELTRE